MVAVSIRSILTVIACYTLLHRGRPCKDTKSNTLPTITLKSPIVLKVDYFKGRHLFVHCWWNSCAIFMQTQLYVTLIIRRVGGNKKRRTSRSAGQQWRFVVSGHHDCTVSLLPTPCHRTKQFLIFLYVRPTTVIWTDLAFCIMYRNTLWLFMKDSYDCSSVLLKGLTVY